MKGAKTIVLITPGHVASTPRLVKEADALVEANYRVQVVAGRHFTPVDQLDAAVFSAAKWPCTLVDFVGGPGVVIRKIARRVARRLVLRPGLSTGRIAVRAHHAETLRFARVAASLRADLYIGHCLAGLPAAALAAGATGARYGFDAEDFHDAETSHALGEPAEIPARRIIHETYMPGCAHLTAAAPLIGERYAATYRVRQPTTVLNVFPLSYAADTPRDPGPISSERPARFYWFSQTVGAGRGLEALIAILAQMRTPVELHLRGISSPDYMRELQALGAQARLARPIQFLESGAPTEMARLAADFDLGLSIEESKPLNRDLCLTNKIFIYLLAGIPQLLSHTSAQAALAPALDHAAILVRLERTKEVAATLDTFFADPVRVAAARRRASQLARARFCWDLEKSRFLDSVARAVA